MTDRYETFVVVNPRSAGGSTGQRWPAIERELRASLGRFRFEFTIRPGDGARLARQALADGYEMVVAVGGDGTLNEVVNGFFNDRGEPLKSDAVVGTIARGTGKDFIRTAGIPKDVSRAIQALSGRATRPWDVGKVSVRDPEGRPRTQYFMNEADFGIGGEVSSRVNAGSKRFGGFVSFLWATLQSVAAYRPRRVRITADGEDLGEQTITSAIVAIGCYCGGGMHTAPTALPDDGFLDLVIVPALRPMELASDLRRLYNGTILQHPRVLHRRCQRVEATSDEAVAIGVDGESQYRLPATFDILPSAIRVKIPEPASG